MGKLSSDTGHLKDGLGGFCPDPGISQELTKDYADNNNPVKPSLLGLYDSFCYVVFNCHMSDSFSHS